MQEAQKIAYGIVRDADGVPKFDEPETVPEAVKAALTDDDLRKMKPETVERLGLKHRIK